MHRDDEVQVQKSSFVICNALKPRKLDDDEFKCAIAVFEPDDPFKRPMYCKNKVHKLGLFEQGNPTSFLIYMCVYGQTKAGN